MIDTMISVKLILATLLGILFLSEIYLTKQTLETATTFGSRSALVGLPSNQSVQKIYESVSHFGLFHRAGLLCQIEPWKDLSDRQQIRSAVSAKCLGIEIDLEALTPIVQP